MNIIHLFSGGLDSTVLLYDLLHAQLQPAEVHCLLFNYGQRHAKELDFAQATCIKLGVTYDVVDLPQTIFKRSSLTTGNKEMIGSATIVPNRNMVMLSIAASFALSRNIPLVSYAANAWDADIYPDCRANFINALNRALLICDTNKVEIYTPYITRSKADVVQIGRKLNVPFDETWSCYEGGDKPCGKCGACQTREKAFHDGDAVE